MTQTRKTLLTILGIVLLVGLISIWRVELFTLAFIVVHVSDLVDIMAVSIVLYSLYRIFRGTRAAQMLTGMLVLILLTVLVRFTDLQGMSWLLSNLSTVWVIALVILFQPELRRVLIYLGNNPWVRSIFRVKGLEMVDEIAEGVLDCRERGWGVLIVIEGDVGLKQIKEKGILINAQVTAELIVSIFNPSSPMHDGAVILNHEILECAKCILPLSEEPHGARMRMGTRHLAALGLSEESDASILVVSEETGTISYVKDGVMKRGLDEIQLKGVLNSLM